VFNESQSQELLDYDIGSKNCVKRDISRASEKAFLGV